MKEIELTKGYIALVDDEDYLIQGQYKWFCIVTKHTVYAARLNGTRKNGKPKMVYLHREILQTPTHLLVNHRNRNGLNCQRYNIQNCTRSQNNQYGIGHGKSKYRGVSIIYGSYIHACIRVNGKLIHLGNCKTEEEAAKRYDVAALKYFGEFAYLNFK